MLRIVVFGAAGRAGVATVNEALRRGHHVTAVVRDPARYTGPVDVRLVPGDVTDPGQVATLAAGHDAAINTSAALTPATFFTDAARALAQGLSRAGVPRLVTAGLAAVLPAPTGTRLLDAPEFPADYRPFALAHAEGLATLRAEAASLDWLYLSPAGNFAPDTTTPAGHYTPHPHADLTTCITYPDFALALLDQATTPTHHQTHLAVT